MKRIMAYLRSACLTACLAGGLASLHAQAPPAGAATDSAPVAIIHVTVVDVASGSRLGDRTVIVRGRRIAAVAPAGSLGTPPGARVVDGSGRFLIPGLWDMHTHVGRPDDLTLLVANGVTGARVMSGMPQHVTWRRDVARGAMVGPRLVLAGPILEGPPPESLAAVIDMEGKVLVRTADDATAAVRAQKAAGYDFIKIYNNLSRPAYEGIVAEARRAGMPVAGHVPFAIGLRGALGAHQSSIEHLRGYVQELVPASAPQQPGADLRSRTLAWQFADTTRVRALAAATRAAGAWNCPTLMSRLYDGTQADVDAFLSSPAAAYIAPEWRASLADRRRIPWLSNFSGQDFANAVAGHARQDALVRALRDAGAGILAGTDLDPWGFTLHDELRRLRGAGLTALEALRTATLNPARYLGATDSLGTVAPGKLADLVLLDADPLSDIENTTRIRAVVANGRVFDRDALDTLLAAARRGRASR
jgi:imidazolonepropionase-like amidohydrolase